MKTSLVKVLFIVLLLILALCAGYYTITNLSFFEIKQISVENSAPVTKTPVEVHRILNTLEGKNIFSVRLSSIRKEIMQTEAVSEVKIKKWYPDRLVVSIKYDPFLAKLEYNDEFYLCSVDSLSKVSKDVWESYTQVREVSIDDSYCEFLSKWGYDRGFFTMISIVSGIESSLISNIIYENDNGNEFGRLILTIKALGVSLYVCEPVSSNEIDESIKVIKDNTPVPVEGVRYDLYQGGSLVRRTQGA